MKAGNIRRPARSAVGERAGKTIGGRRPVRRRFQSGEIPFAAAHAVGQIAQRRQDDGGVVGHAFGHARAFDGIHKRDAVFFPMLAFLRERPRVIVRFPDRDDRVAGGVQQNDRNQFAGFDELVGVAVDQQIEYRFEAILQDRAAEAQRPNDRAQRVGDFVGAVA